MAADIEDLAQRVGAALERGDLENHTDLFTSDLRWGAPDDPEGGCRNRSQALEWYRTARERGVRARVREVLTGPAAIVVGLAVTGRPAADDSSVEADRWLVLAVRDDRVADVRGFDDRDDALSRAGIPG